MDIKEKIKKQQTYIEKLTQLISGASNPHKVRFFEREVVRATNAIKKLKD